MFCRFVAHSFPLQLPGFLPPSRGVSGAVTNKVINDSLTPKPSLRHCEWPFPLLGELRISLIRKKPDLLGCLGSLEGANLIHCAAQRFQSVSWRAGALLLRWIILVSRESAPVYLCQSLPFLCCGKLFSMSLRCSLPHYSGSVYVTSDTK